MVLYVGHALLTKRFWDGAFLVSRVVSVAAIGIIMIGMTACVDQPIAMRECADDQTEQVLCDDGNGVEQWTCIDGRWAKSTCQNERIPPTPQGPDGDPNTVQYPTTDSCTNGDEWSSICTDQGIRVQRCVDRQWTTIRECQDDCVHGEEQLHAKTCGTNGRGSERMICTDGAWTSTHDCIDDDECEDGSQTLDDATPRLGERQLVCSAGQWKVKNFVPATIAGAKSMEGETTAGFCSYDANGQARCWGLNDRYQMGLGHQLQLNGVQAAAQDLQFTQIAYGAATVCGITGDQETMCWGLNNRLQADNTNDAFVPTPVKIRWSSHVQQLTIGSNTGCLVDADGELNCWGDNTYGQLARTPSSTTTYKSLIPLQHVTIAEIGNGTACAATTNGDLYCWGNNHLALVPSEHNTVSTPVKIEGAHHVDKIAIGASHVCVLSEGNVLCWGQNEQGQIGDGTTMARNAPTLISLPGPAVDLALGVALSCAVLQNGLVSCWGRGQDGAIGDSTLVIHEDFVTSPTTNPYITDAVRIAISSSVEPHPSNTVCIIDGQGGLQCWGENLLGTIPSPSVASGAIHEPVRIDLNDAP